MFVPMSYFTKSFDVGIFLYGINFVLFYRKLKEVHYSCDFDVLKELHYLCDFDWLNGLH